MPGRVEWIALDSSFGAPGSRVVVEIERAAGGGSIVHVTWDRRGGSLFGKLFVGLLALTRGIPVRRSFEMGLAQVATATAS